MKKLLLSEIISSIKAKANFYDYDKNIIVKGVSTDTRDLKKGDIYIALRGEKYDGHNFIKIAQSKGACAVISSVKIKLNIPVLLVEDTLLALQNLASYYRKKFNIPIIAITGSNGKTTTKNMIATVLSSKFNVYFTDKNYNNEIGLPKSILSIDDSHEIAILEIGMNHFGEIEKLSNIACPDIAIITNIGKSHIGNLGSQENILKAKLEIISGLKNNGTLILNGDDNFLKNISNFKLNYNNKIIFVGSKKNKNNNIYYKNFKIEENKVNFDIFYKKGIYKCKISMLGEHNILNALISIKVGIIFGININDSINKIKDFVTTPLRTEISYVNGIAIIKDYYNSSPDSANAALKLLNDFNSSGKKIAILGQMLELGFFSGKEHFNLAILCNKYKIDNIFFIGEDYKSFEKGILKNAKCFSNKERNLFSESLKNFVNNSLTSKDVILIKVSRDMKMEEFYEKLEFYIRLISQPICSALVKIIQ